MGPNGLSNQLTKNVVKSALDAEMTEHVDYDRHNAAGRGSGDSRNGTRSKTVLTEIAPAEIDVPRDLRFSPRSADRQELPPRQVADRHACTRPHPLGYSHVDPAGEAATPPHRSRRNHVVLDYQGFDHRRIAAHFQDICGATVQEDTIPVSPTKSSMRLPSGRTGRSSGCTRRYSTTLCTSKVGTGRSPTNSNMTWAQRGSNPRPLVCKTRALPLSYTPVCRWPRDIPGPPERLEKFIVSAV